jgi:hypothetical protein
MREVQQAGGALLRGLKVTFAGTFTEELEIGGWAMDAMALPKKEYSSR